MELAKVAQAPTDGTYLQHVGPVLVLYVDVKERKEARNGKWVQAGVGDDGGLTMKVNFWKEEWARDLRAGDIVFLPLASKSSYRGDTHLTARSEVDLAWRGEQFFYEYKKSPYQGQRNSGNHAAACKDGSLGGRSGGGLLRHQQVFRVLEWAQKFHSALLTSSRILHGRPLFKLRGRGTHLADCIGRTAENIESVVGAVVAEPQKSLCGRSCYLWLCNDPSAASPPVQVRLRDEKLVEKLFSTHISAASGMTAPSVLRLTHLCGQGRGRGWHLASTYLTSVTLLDGSDGDGADPVARKISQVFIRHYSSLGSFTPAAPAAFGLPPFHAVYRTSFLQIDNDCRNNDSPSTFVWVSPVWVENLIPLNCNDNRNCNHNRNARHSRSGSLRRRSSSSSGSKSCVPLCNSTDVELHAKSQWTVCLADGDGESVALSMSGALVLSCLLGCNIPPPILPAAEAATNPFLPPAKTPAKRRRYECDDEEGPTTTTTITSTTAAAAPTNSSDWYVYRTAWHAHIALSLEKMHKDGEEGNRRQENAWAVLMVLPSHGSGSCRSIYDLQPATLLSKV